jgi:uncharacterized membrane protein YhaH (DUF805 family)
MTTDWYYAVEGTSNGPVTAEEFERLIAVGTIRSDTLVWQEGMEDWLPYSRATGQDAGGAMPTPNQISTIEDPARPDANTFIGAIKDALARFVDFKTRSTRSQFWWWVLGYLLISIVAGFIDGAIGMSGSDPVGLLVSVVLLLPSIAVSIRRLHDIGRTGWWLLLMLLPIIGSIVLLVFYCTKTQPAANQWGSPPRR